jgi:dihydroorotase-like cyclic amidohydrolase
MQDMLTPCGGVAAAADTLIEDGTVVTTERETRAAGASVLVRNGWIAGTSPALRKKEADVVDGAAGVPTPGVRDGDMHAFLRPKSRKRRPRSAA